MKLKPDINIPSFLKALRHCHADIRFITAEGDVLNLKSTLSQFVFAAVCTNDLCSLASSIQIEDPQDEFILAEYLITEH